MAPWVKVLPPAPVADELSLILGTHTVERLDSYKLTSAYMLLLHVYTQNTKLNAKG